MSSTGRIAARSAGRNTSLWRISPESAGNAGKPSLSRQTSLAGQNIARIAGTDLDLWGSLWTGEEKPITGVKPTSGVVCTLGSFAPFGSCRIQISEVKNVKIEWVDGSEIKAVAENGEIVISANREGMLALAKHLTALADGIPGDHIHYDVNNSLEDGSTEMIIERIR